MIVDNFDKIRNFLTFKEGNDDAFYLIQIMQRSKDFPEGEVHGTKVIRSYYVSNLEYYNSHIEEIKKMCVVFHARAYIRLNPSSWKACCIKSLGEIANLIENEQYRNIRSVLDGLAGKYHPTGYDKKWIIDVDEHADEPKYIQAIIDAVNECEPHKEETKIIDTIPTRSGMHILTEPFNIAQFRKTYPEHMLDVHKDNPTLLYYNDQLIFLDIK